MMATLGPAVDSSGEASCQVKEGGLPRNAHNKAEKYRMAKTAMAVVVIEVKSQAWEKFGETMENDYQMASKVFWQTIHHLRRGQQDIVEAVFSKDGETLTLTEKIIERWKEHFEELLNSMDTPRSRRQC
ncbi:unnamed protein product [Caretta caretta]